MLELLGWCLTKRIKKSLSKLEICQCHVCKVAERMVLMKSDGVASVTACREGIYEVLDFADEH